MRQRTGVIHDIRRQQVVNAAAALFEARGDLGVSLAEVTQAAGVSRSTLYNPFTTCEDIFAACVTTRQVELVAQVHSAVDAEADGVAQLCQLFVTATEPAHRQAAFFRLMQQMLAKPPTQRQGPQQR